MTKQKYFKISDLTESMPGLVPTLNKCGYMFTHNSIASRAFIDSAKTAKQDLMDVGCAYGISTLKALKNTKRRVIAIDKCQEHLDILMNNVTRKEINNILPICCDFPSDFRKKKAFRIKDENISGILCSHLLTLFTPEAIVETLECFYRLLEVGGFLYLTASTPESRVFNGFYAEYSKRLKRGERWPGIINNCCWSHNLSESERGNLPVWANLLDKKTLSREVEEAGFIIQSINYEYPSNLTKEYLRNGKEYINIICRKK